MICTVSGCMLSTVDLIFSLLVSLVFLIATCGVSPYYTSWNVFRIPLRMGRFIVVICFCNSDLLVIVSDSSNVIIKFYL